MAKRKGKNNPRGGRKGAKKAAKAAKAAAKAAKAVAPRSAPRSAPRPSKAMVRAIATPSPSRGGGGGGRSKPKTQKYIRKILSDGKVSKKEVKKAAKKGIKLDRISSAAQKYTTPGNPFSRSTSGISKYFGRGSMATPKGIRITPGAQKLIGRGVAARGATNFAPTPTQPQLPTGGGDQTTGADYGYDPSYEFDTSYYDDLIAGQDATINDLNMKIGDLTAGFETQLSEMNAAMEAEKLAAAQAMQEMEGNFAQAMAQRGDRARVQGIRFADRGTGGATQAQLARRGLRGTFGRGGERLMKISSLNV